MSKKRSTRKHILCLFGVHLWCPVLRKRAVICKWPLVGYICARCRKRREL